MTECLRKQTKNILIFFVIIVVCFGAIALLIVFNAGDSSPETESKPSFHEHTVDPSKLSTYQGLLEPDPDYSSPKRLAISLSFPLFGSGENPYPSSYTGGGKTDRILASRQYYDAKSRAEAIAKTADNTLPPSGTRNFADCGAFVATVVINTIDPEYPGLFVSRQRDYVHNPRNGWVKVGNSEEADRSSLKIGDVFISSADQRSGHTWIWLGRVGGQDDVIADASFGTDESSTAHLPVLRQNPLTDKGKDSRGREYDIWRFLPQ